MIGLGDIEKARRFKVREDLPFPLLGDPDRSTYRLAGLVRGSVGDVMGPKVWGRGLKSLLSGNRQSRPREDPMQLGGTAVIGAGGKLLHLHVATTSADNMPVHEIVGVLDRAQVTE